MASEFLRGVLVVCLAAGIFAPSVGAQGVSDAITRLIENESLPPERLPAILEMASQRGDASTLGLVFDKAISGEWPDDIAVTALDALADAAGNRKVKPAGDLTRLTKFLNADQPEKLRNQAIQLAGLWQTAEFATPLDAIARDPNTPTATRSAALEALAQFGDAGRATIKKLTGPDQTPPVRTAAISALASLDLDAAAEAAAVLLAKTKPGDHLGAILGIFLERQEGSKILAAKLGKEKLLPDIARASLQHLYSVGRNDAELSAALASAAGIAMQDKPLSPMEIQQIAADAMTEGDPARGELVFRRNDLSCLKCHSVSGAGGAIGPDLSGIGPSNPIDYLVTSIVEPAAAVKEQFATQNVVTADGLVVTGIIANESDNTLTLRTAEGEDRTIPKADIIDRQAGGSLMPQGLVKFMTRNEPLDLVRFLSELGKPGTPYALRSKPTIQRWRLLADPPPAFQKGIPSDTDFAKALPPLSAPNWKPFYARVDGMLHPTDLATREPVYLLAEIGIESGGPVGIEFNDISGLDLWINGDHIDEPTLRTVTELAQGRHAIVLRVDPAIRGNVPLLTTLFPPANSAARAKPVAGT